MRTERDGHGGDATPLDTARLKAAVDAGILSDAQAHRLTAFWSAPDTPGGLPSETAADAMSRPDAEEVRFARGFHDVFVVIGLVLFLFGLGFAVGQMGSTALTAATLALAIWGLSEYFAKRLRLALPSFVLTVAFAPTFLFACLALVSGDDGLGDLFTQAAPPPGLIIPVTFVGIAGGALHYWRFRVPVGIAVVAATLVFLAALLVEVAAPGLLDRHLPWFTLAAGLAAFAAAMRYDARDPARETVASDKGFWLHLLAAPLIVHSVLALTVSGLDELATGDALVVIALFVGLSLVAVLVDRRALLVSGLGTFGIAVGNLVAQANLSGETALAVTLLILGAFVLLLGSGWRRVRRLVGRPFAGGALAPFVPAFD